MAPLVQDAPPFESLFASRVEPWCSGHAPDYPASVTRRSCSCHAEAEGAESNNRPLGGFLPGHRSPARIFCLVCSRSVDRPLTDGLEISQWERPLKQYPLFSTRGAVHWNSPQRCAEQRAATRPSLIPKRAPPLLMAAPRVPSHLQRVGCYHGIYRTNLHTVLRSWCRSRCWEQLPVGLLLHCLSLTTLTLPIDSRFAPVRTLSRLGGLLHRQPSSSLSRIKLPSLTSIPSAAYKVNVNRTLNCLFSYDLQE